MRCKVYFPALLALCLLGWTSAVGAPWLVQYGSGFGSGYDSPGGLGVDSAGNVYVTGTTFGGEVTGQVTLKYSPTGELLWSHGGGEAPRDNWHFVSGRLAVSAGGEPHLLARMKRSGDPNLYRLMVTKLDSDGNRVWETVRNVRDNRSIQAASIAVAGDGSVYLAAKVARRELILIKLNARGEEEWAVERLVGDGDNTYAGLPSTLGLDADGNVYLGGTVSCPGSLFLLSFDPDGDELWSAETVLGEQDTYVGAPQLVVRPQGEAYLTAWRRVCPDDCFSDVVAVKYDTGGGELWRTSSEAYARLEPGGTAVSADGALYITADFNNSVLVLKTTTDGEPAWTTTVDGGPYDDLQPRGVVVDTEGSAQVLMRADSCSPSDCTESCRVVKLDSDGNELWTAEHAPASPVDLIGGAVGFESGVDQNQTMAIAPAGGVYLSCALAGDFDTAWISGEGIRKWRSTFNSPARTQDWVTQIALDSNRNVYASGFSIHEMSSPGTILKYTGDGEQLWTRTIEGHREIAVDAGGAVYAVSQVFHTTRYGPDGEEMWDATFAPSGDGSAQDGRPQVDAFGDLVVGGTFYDPTFDRAMLAAVKYSADGQELWSASSSEPDPNESVRLRAMTLDAEGNVYLAGSLEQSDNPGHINGYSLVKFDAEGNEAWSREFAVGWTEIAGVEVDGAGNVHLGGKNISGVFMTKLDPEGNELWNRRGDTHLSVGGLALDASGNSYLSGIADTCSTECFGMTVTLKYDPDGNQLWMSESRPTAGGSAKTLAVLVDDDGNVCVVGNGYPCDDERGCREEITLHYLDSDGHAVVISRLEESRARAATLDDEGNLYVAGRWSRNFLILKDARVSIPDVAPPLEMTFVAPELRTAAEPGVAEYRWELAGETTSGAEFVHSFPVGRFETRLTATTPDMEREFVRVWEVHARCVSDDTSPWISADLRLTAFSGSATVSGTAGDTTVEVCAGGMPLNEEAQSFHFLYQEIEGMESALIARVSALESPWVDGVPVEGAQVGLMFRTSLSDRSRFAALVVEDGGELSLVWREHGNTPVRQKLLGSVGESSWMGLAQREDGLGAYTSEDGVEWNFVGELGIRVLDARLAGLAVAGVDTGLSYEPFRVVVDGLTIEASSALERRFVRGDCDGDGSLTATVNDPMRLLRFNFSGGEAPPCLSACDADANGEVRGGVTDAVYMLAFLFLGGPPPAAPYPDCGPGAGLDLTLGCASPMGCR